MNNYKSTLKNIIREIGYYYPHMCRIGTPDRYLPQNVVYNLLEYIKENDIPENVNVGIYKDMPSHFDFYYNKIMNTLSINSKITSLLPFYGYTNDLEWLNNELCIPTVLFCVFEA